MFCPDDKMKINRFTPVAIPRNCEYMRRFGKSTPLSNQYTGDERPPISGNKVDMIYQSELMDLQQQREDAKKNDEA